MDREERVTFRERFLRNLHMLMDEFQEREGESFIDEEKTLDHFYTFVENRGRKSEGERK